MDDRWHKKAHVQAALITGTFGVIAAVTAAMLARPVPPLPPTVTIVHEREFRSDPLPVKLEESAPAKTEQADGVAANDTKPESERHGLAEAESATTDSLEIRERMKYADDKLEGESCRANSWW